MNAVDITVRRLDPWRWEATRRLTEHAWVVAYGRTRFTAKAALRKLVAADA